MVLSCCEEAVEMDMMIAHRVAALLKIIMVIIKDSTNVCYNKSQLNEVTEGR